MAFCEFSVCLPSRESARERRSFRRMVQCSMLGSDGGCDEPRWRRERERERGRGRRWSGDSPQGSDCTQFSGGSPPLYPSPKLAGLETRGEQGRRSCRGGSARSRISSKDMCLSQGGDGRASCQCFFESRCCRCTRNRSSSSRRRRERERVRVRVRLRVRERVRVRVRVRESV